MLLVSRDVIIITQKLQALRSCSIGLKQKIANKNY